MKKVHINMCPILDGYGVMTVFYFPYKPSCEPYRTSWRVIVAYFCQLQTVQFLLSGHLEDARFTTERQPVLRPAVAFSKASFKHR
jgi:hypothetical protein